MANRIQTPSKVVDLFGAGKHGFGDDPNPLLATAFDASWCNGIQESVVRTIEAAGLIPDGANFDQFTDAILSFPFDDPTVTTSLTMKDGSFLILEDQAKIIASADGGNGGARIELMAPGSGLTAEDGTILDLLSSAACGTNAANTWTFAAQIQANENVTLAAGKTIDATGAGCLVDADRARVVDLEFIDSGTNIPTSNRRARFNDTTPLLRGADGFVRSWPTPSHGEDVSFTTPNAIQSTTAIAQQQIQETERVRIRVVFDYEHSTGAVGTLNTRLNVNGTPGSLDINILTHLLPASGGVRWRSKTLDFFWRPDDDFVSPGTNLWTITFRLGSSLGADLDARNISIEILSTIAV